MLNANTYATSTFYSSLDPAWKKYKDILPSLSNESCSALDKLRKANDIDLKNGNYDKLVDKFIEQLDKETQNSNKNFRTGMRLLAYVLFSGKRQPSAYSMDIYTALLTFCFIAQHVKRDTIIFVTKEAYNFWQTREIRQSSPSSSLTEGDYLYKKIASLKQNFKSNDTINKLSSLGADDPDRILTIYHAGGYLHIKEILASESLGYPLENNKGEGMQVQLDNIPERQAHYAVKASVNSFDFPALLIAEIEAKYLICAPNSLRKVNIEAGIQTNDVVKNLKIIEIKKDIVDMQRLALSTTPALNKDYLEEKYNANSDIKNDLISTLDRVDKIVEDSTNQRLNFIF